MNVAVFGETGESCVTVSVVLDGVIVRPVQDDTLNVPVGASWIPPPVFARPGPTGTPDASSAYCEQLGSHGLFKHAAGAACSVETWMVFVRTSVSPLHTPHLEVASHVRVPGEQDT